MWRDTVPVILERPLLGHGSDNFAGPFKSYEGEDFKAAMFDQSIGKEQIVDKAHNELLQVAATTGLLGLTAYGWIFVSYFRHAYRSGGWTIIALSGGVLVYILQIQTAFIYHRNRRNLLGHPEGVGRSDAPPRTRGHKGGS